MVATTENFEMHPKVEKQDDVSRQVETTIRRLTPSQKRELKLLRMSGGYCHVFSQRTLNIFIKLEEKGYVELSSGWGAFQSGTHVSLIDKVA